MLETVCEEEMFRSLCYPLRQFWLKIRSSAPRVQPGHLYNWRFERGCGPLDFCQLMGSRRARSYARPC